jgi:Holliday junction resolvase
MGASQRRKGNCGERELVHVLQAAGIPARRVPLSGSMSATGFGGDVLADFGHGHEVVLEVKRRGQGFARIYGWLQDCYALAFRGDREEWLIAMRLEDLIELIERREKVS